MGRLLCQEGHLQRGPGEGPAQGVFEELDLEACRLDQYAGSNGIIKQIKALIWDGEYCVIDLSGERPNVYYEVRYAHGIGHNGDTIIFIADKGTKLHVYFEHRADRFFADTEELRAMLTEFLEAMLSEDDDDE